MPGTYIDTQFVFPGWRTILIGSSCEFYTSAVTYPVAAAPYWTVVLTRRDATTMTIYASNMIMCNPA